MTHTTSIKQHERETPSANANSKRKPRANLAAKDHILPLNSPYLLFRNPAVLGNAIEIRHSIDWALPETIRETMADISLPPDAAALFTCCLREVLQKEIASFARGFARKYINTVLQTPPTPPASQSAPVPRDSANSRTRRPRW